MASQNWSTLIRPRKLEPARDSDRCGRFVCEPLDRGFGDELGRALRQVLLDALPGTAVVAARARLDGHAPEPGWMRELCLNLSQLVLGTGETTPYLRVELLAGSVMRGATLAALGLRVVEPEHPLCVASGRLVLELWLESGCGMRIGSKRAHVDLPDGAVAVDAFFGPVRRADYFTMRSHVGPWRNLDCLLLDIETNGAMSAHEALWTAVRTLTFESRAA